MGLFIGLFSFVYIEHLTQDLCYNIRVMGRLIVRIKWYSLLYQQL